MAWKLQNGDRIVLRGNERTIRMVYDKLSGFTGQDETQRQYMEQCRKDLDLVDGWLEMADHKGNLIETCKIVMPA
jgi:hypothetical protein